MRPGPVSGRPDMRTDTYGVVADSLRYERDGDSAFRELVRMMVNGEMFQERNKLTLTRDKISEPVERSQQDDDLYLQLIKEGIIGVSVVAVVLLFVIIFIIKKTKKPPPAENNNQDPPFPGQFSNLQSESSRQNTIIDLEGKTRLLTSHADCVCSV